MTRSQLSDITLCASAWKRHLLEANADKKWDVFAHSWRGNAGVDMEAWFREAYDLTDALFEDNQAAMTEVNFTSRFDARTSFGKASHTLSMTRVVALALRREAAGAVRYDRFVLVRPDVLTLTDVDIGRLPRGRPYCNSHGRAAGDFHFIFEREHVEAIGAALPPGRFAALGRHGLSFHNYMRDFLAAALPGERGVMANDGQVLPGFDQDVYRKFTFHVLFKCGGGEVARLAADFFDQRYSLSAQSRETIALKVAPFKCSIPKGDYSTFRICVRRPPAPAPPTLERVPEVPLKMPCGPQYH